jgi:hypothetical protein
LPGCVKAVELGLMMWEIPTMTTTADSRKRVILAAAKPGDRFDVQVSPDGAFILRRLKPVADQPVKGRLKKRGKYTVVVTDKPVDMKLVKKLLADFP